MTNWKSYTALFLLLLLILTACANKNDNLDIVIDRNEKGNEKDTQINLLTIEEKIQDFEYLYNFMIDFYPFIEVNKRVNGVDWVGNRESYLESVRESKNDDEFFRVLQLALNDLSIGHVQFLNSGNVEMFREMYYYLALESKYQNHFETLNDDKVLTRYGLDKIAIENSKNNMIINPPVGVDNVKVEDIIDGKVGYIYIPLMIQPNQMKIDELLINDYLKRISNYQVLLIDIRGNRGGSPSYWADYLVPRIIIEPKECDLYGFYKSRDIFKMLFKTEILNDAKLAEWGIYNLEKLDLRVLPNLPPEVENSFEYYNINRIQIRPHIESIKFQGNIYLLIDKYTYSAADLFAVFAKETNFATLIGEKTNGGGISDEPWFIILPNSGYVFRTPFMLGTTSDGSVNEESKTTPHYIINFPKRNDNYDYDLVIQKVLQLEGLVK